MTDQPKAIILFDGHCNLCSEIAIFVIRRDPAKRFLFAALASEKGKEYLTKFELPLDSTSVVLIENEKCYLRSTAVLRILKQLKGAWPLMYGFIILPRPLRDYLYDQFSKHRYQWFGRSYESLSPTPENKERFI